MSNLSSLYKSIEKIMWQDTGLNGDAQRIEQFAWMLFFKIFSDKDQELELLDDAYQSPIPAAYRWDAWAANDEGMTGDELLEFIDRDLFPTLRNLDVSTGNRRALIVREVFSGNNNYMKSGGNLRKVLNKLNEIDFNRAKDRHAFGDIYESILKGLQSAGKSGEFYTPRAVTQFICDTLAPRLGETILDPACGTGGFLTAAVETLKRQATSVADQQELQKVKGWEYKPLPFLLATTNLILHDVEVPNITFRDVLDQPLSTYTQKDRVDVVLANPPFGGVVANGNEKNFPANFRTKESADLFLVLIMRLLKDGGRAGVVLPDGSLTGEGVKQRVRKKLLEDCNLHTIVRLPNSVFKPYATVATNLLFFTKGEPTTEVWYYQHRLPEGQKSYSKTKPIRRSNFSSLEAWWNNRQENEVAWKVPIQTIIERNYDLDIKNPNSKGDDSEKGVAEYIEDLKSDLADIDSNIDSVFKNITTIESFSNFSIGEICKIVKGTVGIQKAVPGDYPLVVTGESRATHNTFQFDDEAVCVPLVSSTGHGHASLKRIHYQSGKFALGTILAAILVKDKSLIKPKYLYYYLSFFKDDLIVSLMKGGANVALSIERLSTVPVLVPSIEKQEQIILLMQKCEELKLILSKANRDADALIASSLEEIFNTD